MWISIDKKEKPTYHIQSLLSGYRSKFMQNSAEILYFIDNTKYLYPNYIYNQLKKEGTLTFIRDILNHSGKELSEAVLILISVIKYTYKVGNAFSKLEETHSFQEYLEENYETLLRLCTTKSVQGNIPERALPLLEVLGKINNNSTFKVIELGASYGMIGRSLLNPEKLIENKKLYFNKKQQIPNKPVGINHYLGIEHDPPDKEWILASVWQEELENRLIKFLDDFQQQENFELIKGNAFGFSENNSVKKFATLPGTIVVLTSFMLYQFDGEKKKQLIDEISRFVNMINGHWINQTVNVSLDSKENEYFIALDGKKVIDLYDDTCLSWSWINE
jgi:hypothetical protein